MKESMQRKIFELSRQAHEKNNSHFFYPQGGGAEHTNGWMEVQMWAPLSSCLIHIKHRHLQNTLIFTE